MIYNDINFDYGADWSNGFNILYGFNTSVFSSTSEREQRCSLRAKPYRNLSFSLWEEKAIAFKILNELRTAYQKTIYVPVHSESFKSSNTNPAALITDSVDYLIATDTLEHHYNAKKLCTDLLVTDIRGVVAPVRTTYDYLSDVLIYMDAISGTFSLLTVNAVFYPLIPCYIDSINIGAETDSVLNFEVNFKEKN